MYNIFIVILLIASLVVATIFLVLGFLSLAKFIFSLKERDVKENIIINFEPALLLFDKGLNAESKKYAYQVKLRFLVTIICVVTFIFCIGFIVEKAKAEKGRDSLSKTVRSIRLFK